MLSYIDSITKNVNPSDKLSLSDIIGGDKKTYKCTIIYLARYTFENYLQDYFKSMNINYINLISQIDNIIINMISELPNEYTTINDLRVNQSKALVKYIELKINECNVFVFPIHGLFTDFNLFNQELKKTFNDDVKFVTFNTNFNILFDLFMNSRARMEKYVNIFYFITWLEHLYKKAPIQDKNTSTSILVERDNMKKILLNCKCFFMDEESIDTVIDNFFIYYKCTNDKLYLESFIDDKEYNLKTININNTDDIPGVFNNIM